MKNFLLSFFIFISIFQLQAENVDRTINWTVPQNIVLDAGHFCWPDFVGSVKSNRNSIPSFFETIKVEQAVSSVLLVNPKLSILNDVPVELAGSVSEEIKFNSHFFYSGKEKYLQIELVPFVKKDGKIFRIDSFHLETAEAVSALKSAQLRVNWAQRSVLSSGKWVKIATAQKGIYKIKYSDLQSWGFSNPASVNVFGNGGYMLPVMNNEPFFDDLQQIAVWRGKDGNNTDCLFFYSTGTIKWMYDASQKMFVHQQNYFSDKTFYFLTDAGGTLLVQDEAKPSVSPNKQVAEYDCCLMLESEELNVINSGVSWYGDMHTKGQAKNFTLNFPGRIETDTLKMLVQTIGRSSDASNMSFLVNNLIFGTIDYSSLFLDDPESDYGRTGTLRKDKVIAGSTISVQSTYNAAIDNSEAWIDFIDANSRCHLAFADAQLSFRDLRTVKSGSVTEYKIGQATSGIKVWDVSNFLQPRSISTELSGTDLKFVVETSQLREFVAFNPTGNIPVPEKIEEVGNQNLHSAAISEFLIITHPRFLVQANELADFHREYDQISVSVYTTDQIYNEFSGGLPDAAGIRNFIRMCYEKGENSLKYVLLFGDGSFDNKNIRKKGYNLIPTYQSDESLSPLSSFISDDFYVLLDQEEGGCIGLVDLGIGRIPARTISEAEAVVGKIKSYVNADALGKWRNVACFIADDGNNADGFTSQHLEQSETIVDMINQNYPAFYTDKIYFDAYRKEASSGMATYPDVNNAINERVKEGVLILNYIGHANEEFLADERVLDVSAINAWSNYKNLPVFVTATCEFSRFDEDELSAGEHILFNPNGGGIGLFSTTRIVFSQANFDLSKSFYNHVFEKDASGENLRMGDIMRLAKNGSNTGINKLNFTLLADPALRLAYPKLNVKTETINGQVAGNFTGTVSALEKITISGRA